MKLSHLKNLSLLFFIVFQTANSQELPTPSASDVFVSRGNSTYTTAQITYKDMTQKPSSTLGDIQYVYEIYSLNLDENKHNFQMKLFPDATSSSLLLELDNYANDELSYQIIDMQGKVLKKAKIDKASVTNNQTQINVILLPISSYILSIFEDDEKIESFKILKSNKY